MLRSHHIHLSRAIAGTAFAMALVLTPRAWVEPQASPDLVPVEVLDQPAKCLWCEPELQPCLQAEEAPAWLNPEQPIQARDCKESKDAKDPSRS